MRPLKLAISGKGGVGKTTVAATLARLYGRAGVRVLLVDADPAATTAEALGIPEDKRADLVPLSAMTDLIHERTGARPGEAPGGFFTLNPKVDDLANRFAVEGPDGVRLLVLGTIRQGGGGCFCPEHAILRRLLRHLVIDKNELVILDMAAGVEHLGRGTAENLDQMFIIVEPGQRSIEIAKKIVPLADEIGIRNLMAIINKTRNESDATIVRQALTDLHIDTLGTLPYSEAVISADLMGGTVFDQERSETFIDAAGELIDRISAMITPDEPGMGS